MKRWHLWLELVVVFVGLPAFAVYRPIPKIPVLLALALVCALALARDPGWDRGEIDPARIPEGALRRLSLRFLGLVSPLAVLAVVAVGPEGMFELAREEPAEYALVALLYPVLSALPQEIVWRSFFFRRYAPLFGGGNRMVAASATAFAFLHVVYRNPIAVAVSFAGGLLFGDVYRRHRSLALVAVEHSLLGLWLFTIGLGRFFYGD